MTDIMTPRRAPDQIDHQDQMRVPLSPSYPRTTSLEFLDRCSRRVAEIYRFWDMKRQGRALPARADFDPLEMKLWLPGIILVDVQHNPRRLTYRLVGSRSVDLRYKDVTGQTVEEGYHGSSLAEVLENYRLVVDERKVLYDWETVPSPDGFSADIETLFLPLSSDGTTVDMVMIYLETQSS